MNRFTCFLAAIAIVSATASMSAQTTDAVLTGIVTDDPDLPSDLRALGMQFQLSRFDEAQRRGVVTIEAEVVDRIAVHGVQRHFFAIEKHGLSGNRPGRHDVTIRQDEPPPGIDDEAGRLARHIPFGVERPGLIDLDRDDTSRGPFQRASPPRILCGRYRHERRGRRRLLGGNQSCGNEQQSDAEGFLHVRYR